MNCYSTSFSTPKALKLVSYNTQNTSRQMPFLIGALPRKCNTKQAQCANRNGETRKKTKKINSDRPLELVELHSTAI